MTDLSLSYVVSVDTTEVRSLISELAQRLKVLGAPEAKRRLKLAKISQLSEEADDGSLFIMEATTKTSFRLVPTRRFEEILDALGSDFPGARNLHRAGNCLHRPGNCLMPLPPTEVEVTTDNPSSNHHRTTATFKRAGANHGEPKTITGEGETPSEAVRDTFRKFLDDPSNGEYFSSKK